MAKIVQVESNTKKLAYFIAETPPIFDFVIKIVQVESNTKKKEDVSRLLSATQNVKHMAILSLIYACGLRRSELLNMLITDIDSKRNVIYICHAKEDKD